MNDEEPGLSEWVTGMMSWDDEKGNRLLPIPLLFPQLSSSFFPRLWTQPSRAEASSFAKIYILVYCVGWNWIGRAGGALSKPQNVEFRCSFLPTQSNTTYRQTYVTCSFSSFLIDFPTPSNNNACGCEYLVEFQFRIRWIQITVWREAEAKYSKAWDGWMFYFRLCYFIL